MNMLKVNSNKEKHNSTKHSIDLKLNTIPGKRLSNTKKVNFDCLNNNNEMLREKAVNTIANSCRKENNLIGSTNSRHNSEGKQNKIKSRTNFTISLALIQPKSNKAETFNISSAGRKCVPITGNETNKLARIATDKASFDRKPKNPHPEFRENLMRQATAEENARKKI